MTSSEAQWRGIGGPIAAVTLEDAIMYSDSGWAPGWPAAIPVAFPRFHDVYQEGKFDDGWGRIEGERGETFEGTLDRALRSGFTWSRSSRGMIGAKSVGENRSGPAMPR